MGKIVYIKANGNDTIFYMKDGSRCTDTKSLGHHEKTLPCCFVRVHKSFIVSFHFVVQKTSENLLKLRPEGLEPIPLGKGFKEGYELAFARWNTLHLNADGEEDTPPTDDGPQPDPETPAEPVLVVT